MEVGESVGVAEGVKGGGQVGVAVGVAEGVDDGVAVGVAVGVAEGVAEGVAVGVQVGVFESVAVKVMVGGAPVTPEFAREIGADGYSENASQAVVTARQFCHPDKAA